MNSQFQTSEYGKEQDDAREAPCDDANRDWQESVLGLDLVHRPEICQRLDVELRVRDTRRVNRNFVRILARQVKSLVLLLLLVVELFHRLEAPVLRHVVENELHISINREELGGLNPRDIYIVSLDANF